MAQKATLKKDLCVIKLKEDAVIASVESDKFELIEITIDSGAAESVIPPDIMNQFPTNETESSIAGEQFVAANGSIIENEGERRVDVFTLDGTKRNMVFQVTGVNKTLASVSRICEKGHVVIFDGDDSYILNKTSGEVIPMRHRNGVWLLEVWVEKKPKEHSPAILAQAFGRQGVTR
jgi:hypothetical protein